MAKQHDLQLIQKLIQQRQTTRLFKVTAGLSANLKSMPADDPLLSDWVRVVAQAVGLGFPDRALLQSLRAKSVPRTYNPDLGAEIADGVLAASSGQSTVADDCFSNILRWGEKYLPDHVQVFILQRQAALLRNAGQREWAFELIQQARKIAANMDANAGEAIEADVMVDEAWAYFHRAKNNDDSDNARKLLSEAEPQLRTAVDDRRLGDLYSARARIEQREGRLDEAVRILTNDALPRYDAVGMIHRGKPRAIVNLAKLKWLLARQTKETNTRTQLLGEALDLLNDAEGMYQDLDHAEIGLARVAYIRGYVLAEMGRFKDAHQQAELLAESGRKLNNTLVQVRAIVLMAMIAILPIMKNNMVSSRQAEASRAAALIREGFRLMQTGNVTDNRVAVKLHTWLGFAQLYGCPCDAGGALESLKAAQDALVAWPDDYVTADLDLLQEECNKIAIHQNADIARLLKLGAVNLHRLADIVDRDSYDAAGPQFKEWFIRVKYEQSNGELAPLARQTNVSRNYIRDVIDRKR